MSKPEQHSVYQVVSIHEDGSQAVETRRTSQAVALNDQSIISSILFRKAWVTEVV